MAALCYSTFALRGNSLNAHFLSEIFICVKLRNGLVDLDVTSLGSQKIYLPHKGVLLYRASFEINEFYIVVDEMQYE